MLKGVPWLFAARGDAGYSSWRAPVVDGLGLTPEAVFIVGSGAVGFSLVVEKAGRPFRKVGDAERPSDVDIAVVDEAVFVRAWETLLTAERRRELRNSICPASSDSVTPDRDRLERLGLNPGGRRDFGQRRELTKRT